MEAPNLTLADLIQQVRHDDNVTLGQIAERSGIPLSTIGAWAVGTRGTRRPPSPELLVKLAKGLRRPEVMVFEAAGVIHPDRVIQLGPGVVAARLVGDMTDEDQRLAISILRDIHRRGHDTAS